MSIHVSTKAFVSTCTDPVLSTNGLHAQELVNEESRDVFTLEIIHIGTIANWTNEKKIRLIGTVSRHVHKYSVKPKT